MKKVIKLKDKLDWDNLDKIISKVNEKEKLIWNELIYLFNEEIRILQPKEWEKRFFWFEEKDIKIILEYILNNDNELKYKIFNNVISNISINNDNFKDFISWWYKKVLFNWLVDEIWKLSFWIINSIWVKALSSFVLRENFNNFGKNIVNIIKNNFTKNDYKILYHMLWIRIEKKIIDVKEDLLKDSIDKFYLDFFLKDLITIDKITYFSNSNYLLSNFKIILSKKILNNTKDKWFNIDSNILNWILSVILKKEEILYFYNELSKKILDWLVNWDYQKIKYIFSKIIFSGDIIILNNIRYKLPDLSISWLNNFSINDKCFKIRNNILHYYKIKENINSMKRLLQNKEEEEKYIINSINKINSEINLLKEEQKQIKEKISNLSTKIANLEKKKNNTEKNIFDIYWKIIELNKINKKLQDIEKIRKKYIWELWTIKRKIIDKDAIKVSKEYLKKWLNIDNIKSNLSKLELENIILEKEYKNILQNLAKSLMKNKKKI